MEQLDDLLKAIKKHKEKFEINEQSTDAEKLRYRIISGKKTKDEYLQLGDDVRAFFESDASEEDKKMLLGYTESLNMICNSIEKKQM